MGNLLRVARKVAQPRDEAVFPFSVPAIRQLPVLDMTASVTFFVGENGSGKSTLLEGIACAAELPSVGAREVDADETLAAQRALANELRLAWSQRSRQGFFLRAEDFFGYLRSQARTDARIVREKLEAEGGQQTLSSDGPGGVHIDEQRAARFVAKYDARSHGESFMDLFSRRVRPGGLYLLDEPEAPLSPSRQLAFLDLLVRSARAGAQFVIATHSPILLACPEARIYSFDASPIAEVAYDHLDHVKVTRDFLNAPGKYLQNLGGD